MSLTGRATRLSQPWFLLANPNLDCQFAWRKSLNYLTFELVFNCHRFKAAQRLRRRVCPAPPPSRIVLPPKIPNAIGTKHRFQSVQCDWQAPEGTAQFIHGLYHDPPPFPHPTVKACDLAHYTVDMRFQSSPATRDRQHQAGFARVMRGWASLNSSICRPTIRRVSPPIRPTNSGVTDPFLSLLFT
jgi:hypothetical protein